MRLQIPDAEDLKRQQRIDGFCRNDNFGLPVYFSTRDTTAPKVLKEWSAPAMLLIQMRFKMSACLVYIQGITLEQGIE